MRDFYWAGAIPGQVCWLIGFQGGAGRVAIGYATAI